MIRKIFDYSKLRGKIREVCGSEKEFATALEISDTTLSSIFNNKSEFRQSQIQHACTLLQIPAEEIEQYFFCEIG